MSKSNGQQGSGDDNNNNSNNDDSNNKDKKLSPTEAAIIEMMKRQNIEQQQQPGALVVSSSTTATAATALQIQNGENNNEKQQQEQQHAFWDTQPMPHGERAEHPEGPIVPNKPLDEIRSEPYTMPNGFMWSNVDVCDETQRTELYHLLANNYVEDDDALFRFDYSPEFLLWALTPPGFRPEFLFGVRSTQSKKLVAFISAIPATLAVYKNEVPIVEINFLCVHKKLRSKRLAPVLIKEVTRRVNLTNTFQAVYTAGAVLPVPVSSARYYHRSLNPRKLVHVGFSRLSKSMTMARMLKLYKLPDQTATPGLRPMKPEDVPAVHKLLIQYLEKFELKIKFTEDEIAHWLLPRPKVIDSFVVETPVKNEEESGDDNGDDADADAAAATTTTEITDFISFYHLPSTILHHNDTLHAAYSYYNVANTVPLIQLMKDALICAKKTGSDVFNALNLMDNQEVFEPLKFGSGDGNLQYYIYNWACPDMPPDKVGIVLL